MSTAVIVIKSLFTIFQFILVTLLYYFNKPSKALAGFMFYLLTLAVVMWL